MIPEQNGFRQNKSTQTALADALNYVYEGLNNKQLLSAIFFDLSRAFDTVNHSLLLKKLESVGVRGVPLKWSHSYLSDRTQEVFIKNTKSSSKKVSMGVPQGSILGPLFFVFINDIVSNNRNKLVLYADDTNVLIRCNSIESLASEASLFSNNFFSWCENNGLKLNIDKTTFMRFLPKNVSLNYELFIPLNGKSIQASNSVKFLGITLDPKLTWEPHIINIIGRLSSICFLIRSLRDTVSDSVIRLMYFGLVQSSLTYGLIFWGSSSHFDKVFIIQKKILRCMDNKKQTYSCKPLFKKYNILTLPCLYIYYLILYVLENKQDFTSVKEVHSYGTRNNQNLHLPYSRLSVSQAFNYQSIKCYNKVYNLISPFESINIVKRRLRTILLDKVYYSVKDFLEDSL